jgi:subtilase family serine protease
VLLVGLAACADDTAIESAETAISEQGLLHRQVCKATPEGEARCHSWVRVKEDGQPEAALTPSGLSPASLRAAYKLTSSGSSASTIAIVDAFDDPNAESDLAVYRSQFGLPACTTANGCFRKSDQNGGTNYPSSDVGWAEEISLDLDMASAICPSCHILLVESTSNAFSDLAAAVDYAAGVNGVVAISNSYGGTEFSTEGSWEFHYNHPGIAVTVSSGDNGFGVEFPAASQFVTAVGGTSLTTDGSARGWHETVWRGAGSGCSRYISKPGWQHDTGCSKRTVADVSAVADPNTGVAVYDTFGGVGGWLVFGGTSVSAPIIAGVYALAGNGDGSGYGSTSYSHLGSLFDVASGSNGHCRRNVAYLCTGVAGYDGPTGNGTPNGTGAF